MFRKKPVEAVSASRFCIRATELPYSRLYRFDRFTVAISKFGEHRACPPMDRREQGPTAFGLLHGSAVYAQHEEPLLPVAVRFHRSPAPEGAFGRAHFDRSTRSGEYILNVDIPDLDGEIARSVDRALERAILSGHNFLHIDCVRNQRPEQDAGLSLADAEKAEKALLQKIEAEGARLPQISFDQIMFQDELTAKAPAWSWQWRDWDFDLPQFKNKATAIWRGQPWRS